MSGKCHELPSGREKLHCRTMKWTDGDCMKCQDPVGPDKLEILLETKRYVRRTTKGSNSPCRI
jgi:hypothetical protein